MLKQTLPHAKITMETRQSVTLVLMGNFLEYFDLMLGVHLAIVLNKVFLPQDTGYEHILRPLTFLLPLLMRPFAAIIWGHIGDSTGRKAVLISTMFIMGGSSLFLTILPTYATWGLASTIAFFLVRSLQSFSSAGEVTGAELYIAETVPLPSAFTAAGLVGVTCGFGGLLACLIGYFTTLVDPVSGWRYAFIIGAFIAVFGTLARKDLKETPEFLNKKQNPTCHRMEDIEKKLKIYFKRNIICLILMNFSSAFIFYFTFSYCNGLLEKLFNYSSSDILLNSSIILLAGIIMTVITAWFAKRMNPVTVFRIIFLSLTILGVTLSFFPCWEDSAFNLRLLQFLVCFLPSNVDVLSPVYLRSFPVLTRMKSSLWSWALAKTFMYALTATICGFITDLNCLLVIMSGFLLLSYSGLHYFKTYYNVLTEQEIRTVNTYQNINANITHIIT